MPQEYFAIDTNSMKWDVLEIPELNAKLPVKACISDPDTGVSVSKIVYKAGFTNISHWHNCSQVFTLSSAFLRRMLVNMGQAVSYGSQNTRSSHTERLRTTTLHFSS
jgi:hypothetical protein